MATIEARSRFTKFCCITLSSGSISEKSESRGSSKIMRMLCNTSNEALVRTCSSETGKTKQKNLSQDLFLWCIGERRHSNKGVVKRRQLAVSLGEIGVELTATTSAGRVVDEVKPG